MIIMADDLLGRDRGSQMTGSPTSVSSSFTACMLPFIRTRLLVLVLYNINSGIPQAPFNGRRECVKCCAPLRNDVMEVSIVMLAKHLPTTLCRAILYPMQMLNCFKFNSSQFNSVQSFKRECHGFDHTIQASIHMIGYTGLMYIVSF